MPVKEETNENKKSKEKQNAFVKASGLLSI